MGIPCVYYGTEQCLNGGGKDGDCFVRESMFGSSWGAFGIEHGHVFNTEHEAYCMIANIASVRSQQAALRYGRQYFLPISATGNRFSDSKEPGGIFAYARVLDLDSIVVAMNVERSNLTSTIVVDERFFPAGSQVIDLLTGNRTKATLTDGKTTLTVKLKSRQIALLKTIS